MDAEPSLAQGDLGPGPRTQVRRIAERGAYDRATVHSILDEGFVCHLGVGTERGPIVVPTLYGRQGDSLYLHGAPANGSLRSAGGEVVCVTVTLVDALVLARSAFHHSVNYRCVMAYGTGSEVTDEQEKRRALEVIVEHVLRGRSAGCRPPSAAELRGTRVVRVDITEASAKTRSGGPKEEPEDLLRDDIWAGEVPLELSFGVPRADDQGPVRAPVPDYVRSFHRGFSRGPATGGLRGPGPPDR